MARIRVDGRFAKDGAEPEWSGTGEGAKLGRPMRAPRPQMCRSFVRKRIAEQMPGLVEMLMKQANEGSLGHLKILVGLAGLDKGEVAPAVKRREKSLEAVLLEQWAKDDALAATDGVVEARSESEDWGLDPHIADSQ